eukprot:TRINITY_DN1549_c0_g1_i1.p1 TRINITY_DN1549_c0_g1~~TRINITY_DN1549_c0_g1_i1.p1  ORF type:complete len:435 (-),score=83.18 TRINITY_DN1549_c0_g1_i1:7-1257(-)
MSGQRTQKVFPESLESVQDQSFFSQITGWVWQNDQSFANSLFLALKDNINGSLPILITMVWKKFKHFDQQNQIQLYQNVRSSNFEGEVEVSANLFYFWLSKNLYHPEHTLLILGVWTKLKQYERMMNRPLKPLQKVESFLVKLLLSTFSNPEDFALQISSYYQIDAYFFPLFREALTNRDRTFLTYIGELDLDLLLQIAFMLCEKTISPNFDPQPLWSAFCSKKSDRLRLETLMKQAVADTLWKISQDPEFLLLGFEKMKSLSDPIDLTKFCMDKFGLTPDNLSLKTFFFKQVKRNPPRRPEEFVKIITFCTEFSFENGLDAICSVLFKQSLPDFKRIMFGETLQGNHRRAVLESLKRCSVSKDVFSNDDTIKISEFFEQYQNQYDDDAKLKQSIVIELIQSHLSFKANSLARTLR